MGDGERDRDFANFEQHGSGFGSRMLAKMGFKVWNAKNNHLK